MLNLSTMSNLTFPIADCGFDQHISLEEAGLEEATNRQPIFGFQGDDSLSGGVLEYIDWFHDGQHSEWDD